LFERSLQAHQTSSRLGGDREEEKEEETNRQEMQKGGKEGKHEEGARKELWSEKR
jgi:hypothetical protein